MKRHTIFITTILSIFLIYCLCISVVAPFFIKPLLAKKIPEFITGEVLYETLFINPLTNTVKLKDLRVKNGHGETLIFIEEVYIDLDPTSLITAKLDIGSFEINGLKLYNKDENGLPWLTIELSKIENISVSQNNISIKSFSINEVDLSTILNLDQSLNFETFLAEINGLIIPGPSQEEEEEETEPWLVQLDNFTIEPLNIKFFDKNIDQGDDGERNQLGIYSISFKANTITSDLSHDISISLGANVLGGKIKLQGSINPLTYIGDFDYQITQLLLVKLNPYIEHYSHGTLKSGTLSTQGEISSLLNNVLENENLETVANSSNISEDVSLNELNADENALVQTDEKSPQEEVSFNAATLKESTLKQTPPRELSSKPDILDNIDIRLTNQTQIDNLILNNKKFNKSLLNCQSIKTDQLLFQLKTLSLNLKEILLQKCDIHVSMLKSGDFNFDLSKSIPSPTTKEKPEQSNSSSESLPLGLTIDLLQVDNSSVSFEDLSPSEKVLVDISDIKLTVKNISQGENDLTEIDFFSRINRGAPFSVKGNGNFLNPKISTKTLINIQGLGMSDFSPYMKQLSGRPIEKGILSLSVDIILENDQILITNDLVLQGLTLGGKEKVENASKLPIKTAIQLLKNRKDEIHISIPITGNISDPSFSITKQAFKTLRGIITKAATAPISLLENAVPKFKLKEKALFFKDTKAELDQSNMEILVNLAKHLVKNPEMALKMESFLSSPESIKLTSDEEKQGLSQERKEYVTNFLIDKGVIEAQIGFSTFETANIKEKAQISLELFSR